MSFVKSSLSVLGKLSTVLILSAAFLFGLGATVYMALRSPEVEVPQIAGKDASEAEKELAAVGLKLKQRTTRFSEKTPNTILEQTPLAGDKVKAGQTISVVVARAEAESGEKAAEVKKETVNDNSKKVTNDNQSEVDKSRQKRKAANKNLNSNANKNANSNASSNSNTAAGNANGGNANRPANTNSTNRPAANRPAATGNRGTGATNRPN